MANGRQLPKERKQEKHHSTVVGVLCAPCAICIVGDTCICGADPEYKPSPDAFMITGETFYAFSFLTAVALITVLLYLVGGQKLPVLIGVCFVWACCGCCTLPKFLTLRFLKNKNGYAERESEAESGEERGSVFARQMNRMNAPFRRASKFSMEPHYRRRESRRESLRQKRASDHAAMARDAEDPAAPAAYEVTLEVPSGCFGGDEVSVGTPDGATRVAVLPAGAEPGASVTVRVPVRGVV